MRVRPICTQQQLFSQACHDALWSADLEDGGLSPSNTKSTRVSSEHGAAFQDATPNLMRSSSSATSVPPPCRADRAAVCTAALGQCRGCVCVTCGCCAILPVAPRLAVSIVWPTPHSPLPAALQRWLCSLSKSRQQCCVQWHGTNVCVCVTVLCVCAVMHTRWCHADALSHSIHAARALEQCLFGTVPIWTRHF